MIKVYIGNSHHLKLAENDIETVSDFSEGDTVDVVRVCRTGEEDSYAFGATNSPGEWHNDVCYYNEGTFEIVNIDKEYAFCGRAACPQ